MNVIFFFSNGLSFKYKLNETETAFSWLNMMQRVSPDHMLRQDENHRHGFATIHDIKNNIQRLKDACKVIGMPEVNFTLDNWQGWQSNLNDIHVEFPAKLRIGINNRVAHTCNLLIHWLEYELSNLFDNNEQYLFNLDFNHQPEIYNLIQEIPARELSNFTTDISFGTLNLHYVYIGRHYLEMCNAQDFICLQEHFRPQWHFNATCAINFSEMQSQIELQKKMLDYYHARGGLDFFKMEFDDPGMAKGFFKLGEMKGLSQYTITDRIEIRESLKTAYVTNWKVELS